MGRSSYIVDVTDTRYVNAIATHNKEVWITKVNGIKRAEGLRGKDLPALIKELSWSKIIHIKYIADSSLSTAGLFPKLQQNTSKLYASDITKKIITYLEKIFHLQGRELLIAPPKLPALDINEANKIALELNDNWDLSGIMHFPECTEYSISV